MKKRSKYFYGIMTFLCLLLIIHVPSWADTYLREVVSDAIEKQVENRRGEINDQIKKNIREALKDEKTQEEVQILLQEAVSTELEKNGEQHLRRIIQEKAPHALPLLFPTNEE